MIIQPQTRGFICVTAHPEGCAQNVRNQIEYVQSKGPIAAPKRVLVIGSSTGFGLSSRISSAFGSGASTIGVFFEKPPQPGRTASAGWYNTAAFTQQAHKAGLYAKNINGDAFSTDIKNKTTALIKQDLGQIDLVIYSLASPVRTHPVTGIRHKSTLKPLHQAYSNKTVDFHTGVLSEVTIEPGNAQDSENTVAVMGGEDWEMWMDALQQENLLAPGAKTVAYSYIGPESTKAIYRNGTIGKAKDHLEKSAFTISEKLKNIDGKAYVSVNKALVTQSSAAIPVIPLYIMLLYQVMKEKGIHEGCIEQIHRLYAERIFKKEVPTDEQGRIRIDDWEMREDVQQEIAELWEKVTTENLPSIGDLEGYKTEFFNLFGFRFDAVDYEKDTDAMVEIAALV